MTAKPRLLDLFCGAGGCAKGYQRAGFYVTGIDRVPQPNYCGDEFSEDDALVFLDHWRDELGTYFDAIHASPPCQSFTAYRRKGHGVGDGYDDLIAETRELLNATGLPWVIENVKGAPLRTPLMLCGSMFDPPLDVQRHRYFETNWPAADPPWACRHTLWAPRFPGATNRLKYSRKTVEVGAWRIPLETQRAAMGIDWMTLEELSQAVPPTYTEFIGHQLMQHLAHRPVLASALGVGDGKDEPA